MLNREFHCEFDREPDYSRISATLKLLAHPERLRILDALRHDAECVCHLEVLLNKPQPYVSQQLRLLRELGVIADEKAGNNVYYRLADRQIATWLAHILGPVTRAQHQQIEGCPCPKCNRPVAKGNPATITLINRRLT